MAKKLIVVDMQNDFITGSLGSREAKEIVPEVVNVINCEEWDNIYVTYDTHEDNYLTTREGKYLPVEHCIRATDGWNLNEDIARELSDKNVVEVFKPTFGSTDLINYFDDTDDVYIVGLCTDICVVSNAMLLKAFYPEMNITVYENACAGVTPESHQSALTTMKMCQINVEHYGPGRR